MTGDAGLATLLRGDDTEAGRPADIRAFSPAGPGPAFAPSNSSPASTRPWLRQSTPTTAATSGRGAAPATNPAMVPWDELPEHLRESNRDQAGHIGVKLRAMGCRAGAPDRLDEPLFTFSADEVERLAWLEHDRWWTSAAAAVVGAPVPPKT